MTPRPLRIGVLAVQGGFAAHTGALHELGAVPVEVRSASHLQDLDGLVIPGGESTTISMALEAGGLGDAIRAHVEADRALLGTCAGLILSDREHLGLIDVICERNAYGRQLASFEAEVEVQGIGPEAFRAVFIRAPRIVEVGDGVEVLGEHDGDPVAVRAGGVMATAFHPELTDDRRIHASFMALCAARVAA